jgi:hypothetical protein
MNIPQSVIAPFGQIGIPTLKPESEIEEYTFTTESGIEMTMIKQRINVPSRKINLTIQWEDNEVIHE